jgi:hypothetical protein
MLNKGTPNQTQPAGNPIQLQQGVPTKFSLVFSYWYTGLSTWSVQVMGSSDGIQITANVASPIQLAGGVGYNDQIIPDAVTILATAPVGTVFSLYVTEYSPNGGGQGGSVAVIVTAPPYDTIRLTAGDNYISFSKLRTDLVINQILAGIPGYIQIWRYDPTITTGWVSCGNENIKPDTGYYTSIPVGTPDYYLTLTGTDIPSSLSDIGNSLKNGYNLVSCGITPLDVSTSPLVFTDPITSLKVTTLLPTKSYLVVYPPGCSGTIAVV